jgi:hypothetical protein
LNHPAPEAHQPNFNFNFSQNPDLSRRNLVLFRSPRLDLLSTNVNFTSPQDPGRKQSSSENLPCSDCSDCTPFQPSLLLLSPATHFLEPRNPFTKHSHNRALPPLLLINCSSKTQPAFDFPSSSSPRRQYI